MSIGEADLSLEGNDTCDEYHHSASHYVHHALDIRDSSLNSLLCSFDNIRFFLVCGYLGKYG